jgi:hypothetical protein
MKKVGKKLGVAASEKVGALAMLIRGKSRDSKKRGSSPMLAASGSVLCGKTQSECFEGGCIRSSEE